MFLSVHCSDQSSIEYLLPYRNFLDFFKEHLHGAVKPPLVHCYQLEVSISAVLDQMPGEETPHNLTVAILNIATSLGFCVGSQHFLGHKVADSGANFSNGLRISKTKSS